MFDSAAQVASDRSQPAPLLELRSLEAGYGRAALVLRGLSVSVNAGSLVCLVGPNGAGKSTALRVASGLLKARSGTIVFKNEDVTALGPELLLRRGISHVLQGHSVFKEMTVAENLMMGGFSIRNRALLHERLDLVRDAIPLVAERWGDLAGVLSGGQQKLVEFGRSLMLDPEVVLMDEPTMGLDPRAAAVVFEQIGRLRDLGKAILLVEQNARRALEVADWGCVLDLGTVSIEGPASRMLADPRLAKLYLGGRADVDPAARAGLGADR